MVISIQKIVPKRISHMVINCVDSFLGFLIEVIVVWPVFPFRPSHKGTRGIQTTTANHL